MRERVRSVKGVKDLAIDYLEKPRAIYQKGGGRKEITLRVTELSQSGFVHVWSTCKR